MNQVNVPTIDLQKDRSKTSQLKLLDSACRDHGFFLLKNHGMQKEIDDMWKMSEWFFNQPREEKLNILRTDVIPLGYFDRELTKQKRDLKEVFDFMYPKLSGEDLNQWPGNNEFKSTMETFFSKASQVAEETLQLIFLNLNSEDSKLPNGEASTSNARLNYYPTNDPLEEKDRKKVSRLGDMALHHHTDPGILTLLLQDMTGGLQTKSKEFGWIDIEPEEDTIVVNLGDAMQVWTNDRYIAAIHRVTKRTKKARYSTPFFYNPKRDAVIQPLEQILDKEPKYNPFTWKEYIQGRVDDNYSDLGEEDIQISRFRAS
ncbi:MAG TPA: 2-oxoglutarate and iron-dependent oxygenase domain-containing protein [SAR86 cluster bacterium]|nr:2-oxoglutarate and iron-dependent oxygenase domain-containing protein [SAR86 cluster bacterium]|tara:strand:- start:1281 stop:2225 length:945 start_codon:yes stop_codon:yes gene_type:complete